MAYLRFWRRIRILPGVYLNISKRGISFSFGPRGLKYTIGKKGRRISAGLPGTGLFYIKQKSRSKSRKTAQTQKEYPDEEISKIMESEIIKENNGQIKEKI